MPQYELASAIHLDRERKSGGQAQDPGVGRLQLHGAGILKVGQVGVGDDDWLGGVAVHIGDHRPQAHIAVFQAARRPGRAGAALAQGDHQAVAVLLHSQPLPRADANGRRAPGAFVAASARNNAHDPFAHGQGHRAGFQVHIERRSHRGDGRQRRMHDKRPLPVMGDVKQRLPLDQAGVATPGAIGDLQFGHRAQLDARSVLQLGVQMAGPLGGELPGGDAMVRRPEPACRCNRQHRG